MTRNDGVVRWEELSWPALARLRDSGCDMVLLPVGATEQHGPHLPCGVDTLSAVTVAEGVSARTGIPVLPALAYGCSMGHSAQWAGTLSLRPETLSRLVADIAGWLDATGFRRLVILNGHVTNWAPLRCALENIRHDHGGMRVALRSLWEISGAVHAHYHADAANFHANCAETSLMLAVRPDLVDLNAAVDEPDRARSCFFAYTMDQETETGTVGTPTAATPTQGQDLLELCITHLAGQLERARTEGTPLEDWHEAPPPETES